MTVYEISKAKASELSSLPSIELAAAALFDETDLPKALRESPLSISELREAHKAGFLWVVRFQNDVVGFVMVTMIGSYWHIKEMDVHPNHARKGLGRKLLECVFQEARQDGVSCITLTTFSHLPWNAPFYEKLGFEAFEPDPSWPELRAALAAEQSLGLSNRIAMKKLLSFD